MIIYLDRYFNFYTHNPNPWIEVEVEEPVMLSVVLARVGIPIAEVYLASVNDEAVDSKTVWVSRSDQVKIYPPFGGG
jgi:sulfur carrier protein ThiS